MEVLVRVLDRNDLPVLAAVAPDVFDHQVDSRWAAEFLADPRHHLAVAVADGLVVGMASGVHYVHPDKPPELWVNEVGVAPTHQNQGLGRQLLRALRPWSGTRLRQSLGGNRSEQRSRPATVSGRRWRGGRGAVHSHFVRPRRSRPRRDT